MLRLGVSASSNSDPVSGDGAGCCSGSGCRICRGLVDDVERLNTDPVFALNADDRGLGGVSGKVSFDVGQAAAQLTRSGASWAPGALGQATNVTFGFRSTAPTTMPDDTSGFTRFSDVQIAVTLQALAAWSDVANITFTRVADDGAYTNNATMLFGNYSAGSAGAAAFAYFPGSRATSSAAGDVWINSTLSYNAQPAGLNYGPHVLAHEIGHAIGISHPAPYNAAEGVSITYASDAVYYEDSRQYTIMSYFSETNTGGNFTASGVRQYSAVPLMDDIAAAQRLYGANLSTRTGNDVYGFNGTAGGYFTASSSASSLIFAIWDAGGIDTLDASGFTQGQLIDLRQGAFSNLGALVGNVGIAIGAVIENAVGGAGADRIFGNAGDNILTGGGGADTIDGGLGTDTVVFSGNRSGYTIEWNGSVGTVSGGGVSTRLTNIEFLRFSDQTVAAAPTGAIFVSGDITDNVLSGSGFGDVLAGAGGNDLINGLSGADTLRGDAGADTINAGDGDDWVSGGSGEDTLDGGSGQDTVDYRGSPGGVSVDLSAGQASGAHGRDTLSAFENISGSAFDDLIVGSDGANVLRGEGGADTLRGGAGNDLLIAGDGIASGGAPDVQKGTAQANGSIETAVNLDNAFDLVARSGVADGSTIPHATVVAQAHGGAAEYYAFTVAAGQRVVLDIDGASFDSTLRIFNASGAELASNDDSNPDGGSATDSLLSYTFAQAGTYYVQVGRFAESATGSGFQSLPPASGQTYTLHVSVTGHAVAPTTLLGSRLDGGAGSDTIVGGSGIDTLVLSGSVSDYTVEATTQGFNVRHRDGSVDSVSFVEQVEVEGRVMALSQLATTTVFDPYRYMAAYADLRAAFANNPDGAYQHYLQQGISEGRSATAFDVLRYIASNPDLIRAFGTDTASASRHYVLNGINEGRSINAFDPAAYAATHVDLARIIGADGEAAARHYIGAGFYEGRATSGFDALRYSASYSDLARAFGVNASAAQTHYLAAGADEGRNPTLFDARLYTATYLDLSLAFGVDARAATTHYLQSGVYEGRAISGFDAVGYLLSYGDLAGLTPDQALTHWLGNGVREGRVGDSIFGREQTGHNLGQTGSAGEISGQDRDWFSFTLNPGQQISLGLGRPGIGSGLADGSLAIHDALGRLVAFDSDSGPGNDPALVFRSDVGGTFYVVVAGERGANGSYVLTGTKASAVSTASEVDLDLVAAAVSLGLSSTDDAPLALIDEGSFAWADDDLAGLWSGIHDDPTSMP